MSSAAAGEVPVPDDTVGAAELARKMFPTTVPCIAAAARLGIADVLAGGPATVEELAAATSCDHRGLDRVLAVLVDEGVFARDTAGAYRNTPLSDALRADSPVGLTAMARLVVDDWLWTCWRHLADAVLSGRPAFGHAFGEGAWPWLAARPEQGQTFHRAMAEFSAIVSRQLAESYPGFGRAGIVCDLGGGTGTFLATILDRYPQVRHGIVVDSAEVVAQARTQPIPLVAAAGPRIEFVAGDFLAQVPAGADIYVGKQIAHSWPDNDLECLLKNVRTASPHAQVVLAEFVRDPRGTRFALDFDLTMYLTMPGAVRSREEFAAVFERAGYRLRDVVGETGALSLVVADPAG